MSKAFSLDECHSSSLGEFTRVKSHKKQPKNNGWDHTTTIPCREVRKRNPNIGRICELALQSLLDYIPQENESEISKSLG